MSDRAASWAALLILVCLGGGLQVVASVVVSGGWMSAQAMGSIMGIAALMRVIEKDLKR